MDWEIELAIVTIIGIATGIIAYWFSLRLSSRIERRALQERDLKSKVADLMAERDSFKNFVAKQNQQINSLESKLRDRDGEIADLRERLKFAEKVSKNERDSEKLRASIENRGEEILRLLEKLEKLSKQERRRGTEEK
jgi:TolA-binding protein